MIGPVGHIFYEWLDRAVKRMFLPATPGFVVAKVLGDALIFGPVHVAGEHPQGLLCCAGCCCQARLTLWVHYLAMP